MPRKYSTKGKSKRAYKKRSYKRKSRRTPVRRGAMVRRGGGIGPSLRRGGIRTYAQRYITQTLGALDYNMIEPSNWSSNTAPGGGVFSYSTASLYKVFRASLIDTPPTGGTKVADYEAYMSMYEMFRIKEIEVRITVQSNRGALSMTVDETTGSTLTANQLPVSIEAYIWCDNDGINFSDATSVLDATNLGLKPIRLYPGRTHKFTIKPRTLRELYTDAATGTVYAANSPKIWLPTNTDGQYIPHYSMRLVMEGCWNSTGFPATETPTYQHPPVEVDYRYTLEFKDRKAITDANVDGPRADTAIGDGLELTPV